VRKKAALITIILFLISILYQNKIYAAGFGNVKLSMGLASPKATSIKERNQGAIRRGSRSGFKIGEYLNIGGTMEGEYAARRFDAKSKWGMGKSDVVWKRYKYGIVLRGRIPLKRMQIAPSYEFILLAKDKLKSKFKEAPIVNTKGAGNAISLKVLFPRVKERDGQYKVEAFYFDVGRATIKIDETYGSSEPNLKGNQFIDFIEVGYWPGDKKQSWSCSPFLKHEKTKHENNENVKIERIHIGVQIHLH